MIKQESPYNVSKPVTLEAIPLAGSIEAADAKTGSQPVDLHTGSVNPYEYRVDIDSMSQTNLKLGAQQLTSDPSTSMERSKYSPTPNLSVVTALNPKMLQQREAAGSREQISEY